MEVIVGIPRTQGHLPQQRRHGRLFGVRRDVVADRDRHRAVRHQDRRAFCSSFCPAAIIHAGGLAAMQQRLPAGFLLADPHRRGEDPLVFSCCTSSASSSARTCWQRVFTARSIKVARNGGIAVGVYCLAYAMAGALIGTAGSRVPAGARRPGFGLCQYRQRGAAGGLARARARGVARRDDVDRERLPAGLLDRAARRCLSAPQGRRNHRFGRPRAAS